MRLSPLFFFPVALAGCSAAPTNPSFPLTHAQARRAIEQMQADPRPLSRPLIVIGGFLDPDISPTVYRVFFRSVTKNAPIITVSVGFCGSFAECRQKVIAAVDAACPSHDPIWTTRVDVVGVSLGGLVARYAAAPSPDPAHSRRLRIARLFSISSPHSGAELADRIAFTDFHRSMRPGSAFLSTLAADDAQADYDLYPYVHLQDRIVGARYAAPPGRTAFWLSDRGPLFAHNAAIVDDRIFADIVRRLRRQPPFSHFPPTPLPSPG
jgi:pimeloyl-ACP methyl ester carboxylesterase